MDNKIGIIIAIYGAIVGTVSLLTHIIVAIRDRASITIQARKVCFIDTSSTYDSNEPHIAIVVANRGRRPVSICEAGFKMKGKSKFVIIESVAHHTELTEGKSVSYKVSETSLDCSNIRRAYIKDETGKEFKRRVARQLRRIL